MRILFFSHYFPPEVNAPANRTHEHCREWVKAGHDVHVVTCVPSHPVGRPFPGYTSGWYSHEVVDGIHVHRVWTYLAANRGLVRRIVNYLSFVPTAVMRALRLGRFDVAIGTSPQFFCACAAGLFGRLTATPWVFELRDLWPDSIAAVGAMRKSLVLRLIERLELRLYREAAAIVCVTQSFISNLKSRGVDPAKLHYVPNGIEPGFWQATPGRGCRCELGFQNQQVVVTYAGTIGMAHGLGTVLQAAAVLRDTNSTIRILIVGDGAELPKMRELAARERLTNVSFTGLVPRQRVPAILAASDVVLVTLKASDVFKTVLPSKMFEAMAAHRPIVLAVDGEARATLDRAGAGVFVTPGDPAVMAEAIRALAHDPARRSEMGDSGGTFVAREFNRRTWAERYVGVLGYAAGVSNEGPVSAAFPMTEQDASPYAEVSGTGRTEAV